MMRIKFFLLDEEEYRYCISYSEMSFHTKESAMAWLELVDFGNFEFDFEENVTKNDLEYHGIHRVKRKDISP